MRYLRFQIGWGEVFHLATALAIPYLFLLFLDPLKNGKPIDHGLLLLAGLSFWVFFLHIWYLRTLPGFETDLNVIGSILSIIGQLTSFASVLAGMLFILTPSMTGADPERLRIWLVTGLGWLAYSLGCAFCIWSRYRVASGVFIVAPGKKGRNIFLFPGDRVKIYPLEKTPGQVFSAHIPVSLQTQLECADGRFDLRVNAHIEVDIEEMRSSGGVDPSFTELWLHQDASRWLDNELYKHASGHKHARPSQMTLGEIISTLPLPLTGHILANNNVALKLDRKPNVLITGH